MSAHFGLSKSVVGSKKADIVSKLLELSKNGALEIHSSSTRGTSAIKLSDDDSICLSLREWLERGEENAPSVRDRLREELLKLTVDELKSHGQRISELA